MIATETYRQLHGSDQLALLFHAAKVSADEGFFRWVLNYLDSSIATLRPVHDDSVIRSLLEQAKGTPLEPFVLGERSQGLAARFVQIVFSSAGSQSEVRIVSEDALSNRGGLVIASDLSTRYVERFSGRADSYDHAKSSHFAPLVGLTHDSLDRIGNPVMSVSCRPDEAHGYVLELVAQGLGQLAWDDGDSEGLRALENDLLNGSRFTKNNRTAAQMGLGVKVSISSEARVRFFPGSPEALVQFSALLAAGDQFVIEPKEGSGAVSVVTVDLAVDGEKSVALEHRLRRKGAMLKEGFFATTKHRFELEPHEIGRLFAELEKVHETAG